MASPRHCLGECARSRAAHGHRGRAGYHPEQGERLLMRLPLLALIITFGYAHAADWHMLPDSAAHAVPQARTAPATTGIPQIINGIPTGAYPAVAALYILNAEGEFGCSGTLVSPSTILTAGHCVADVPP